ncbi:MAG TPA: glutathione S-transferase family protein [Phenylobacterium sp.]|jgi:glutathione S-transferase|uniref:glutathione S-transferase family protein n=1 Tax=Phenylobacterium sp. TaxID=1871053 RepID=UPI002C93E57B|nr:glutathione S-transferase family protein [Phenylobacterium sp.]HXA38186.1 glutathione S-transferase family protein [Phenylobacterium sp.]
MIIYGSTMSPYVRKTAVFATEKGIDFELVMAGGQGGPPEFKEASPFGKMPGFKDGDFLISDSTAIITYLDTIKPQPNLIPTEAKARARTIWYEEFGDTIVAACGGKIFFNRVVSPRFFGRPGDLAAADEAQKIEFPKLMDYLETVIPASGYLVEDRFTLADIAVVSPLLTMSLADCSVDCGAHPKAAAYVAAIGARPSFAKLIAQEKAQLAA